ncbi:SDR family NAD(P)-dependent oxidoreductase [Cellulomonas xiejunii]|uniref:SDR family NAD(P)-dependent oxidoreductase n=1 Tax=Cellulomonas xiejunii TaxID=2968083 RepID=A0ABY5KPG7_9CELL|nr:SDR family NAD(P)-dependent oxidoreductase [Cellulomonas xiejunii]MCC2320687.1 SDR family NAD(P)-dependent oxidoreductase [Cellulomonas xiejunii]UUI70975.1 SDR family NAD(P)-dependent oxidoreductase [Cellulomonas xiejunii]
MTGPVLITGATGGLGQATARAVAREGHPLLLVVRDLDRGEAFARTLRESTPGIAVSVRRADLADLSSVRALVDGLIREEVVPRAVVCNAGLQVVDGIQWSPDGYELTMATNVLGHVALLAPILEHMGPGSRVVTIGSETHRGGAKAFGFPAARWTDMTALLRPPPGTPSHQAAGRVRYSTSKLACIALAYEIDARWRGRGVRAAAFDPGLMPETGLAREYPPAIRSAYAALTPLLVWLPGARRVTDSAVDLAWLATAEEAEPLMGRYVSERRARDSSAASHRAGLGAAIWDGCLAAAGVEPTGA